jgi:beta-lactamase regulating signal transducer with metallopeptidase domain
MTGSDWLTQPWALKLGWTLVHFLWQGAALSLLAALLLFALKHRSASARYGTACFLFFGMTLLPAITYRWIEVEPTPVSEPLLMNLDVENWPAEIPLAQPGEMPPTAGVTDRGANLFATPTETSGLLPGKATILQALEPHLPWMVMAWLLGVALLSVRQFFGWVLVRRLRRRFIEPVSEEIARRSSELAAWIRVSRPVVVLKSQLARAPLTFGWLRPVILLPASALSGLSSTQLAAILAHELAHIRRYDYLINLFQIAVETLLFYHPGVWWISHRIRIERENCCDDIAVRVCGDAKVYAGALAEVASLEMDPSPALGLADGSLTSRIRRILLQPEATSPKTFSGWFAGIVIVALITAFAVVGEGEESRALEEVGLVPVADMNRFEEKEEDTRTEVSRAVPSASQEIQQSLLDKWNEWQSSIAALGFDYRLTKSSESPEGNAIEEPVLIEDSFLIDFRPPHVRPTQTPHGQDASDNMQHDSALSNLILPYSYLMIRVGSGIGTVQMKDAEPREWEGFQVQEIEWSWQDDRSGIRSEGKALLARDANGLPVRIESEAKGREVYEVHSVERISDSVYWPTSISLTSQGSQASNSHQTDSVIITQQLEISNLHVELNSPTVREESRWKPDPNAKLIEPPRGSNVTYSRTPNGDLIYNYTAPKEGDAPIQFFLPAFLTQGTTTTVKVWADTIVMTANTQTATAEGKVRIEWPDRFRVESEKMVYDLRAGKLDLVEGATMEMNLSSPAPEILHAVTASVIVPRVYNVGEVAR